MKEQNARERFESALAGELIEQPIYAVYDWFVNNRPAVDWESLFTASLGQINHGWNRRKKNIKISFTHLNYKEVTYAIAIQT